MLVSCSCSSRVVSFLSSFVWLFVTRSKTKEKRDKTDGSSLDVFPRKRSSSSSKNIKEITKVLQTNGGRSIVSQSKREREEREKKNQQDVIGTHDRDGDGGMEIGRLSRCFS